MSADTTRHPTHRARGGVRRRRRGASALLALALVVATPAAAQVGADPGLSSASGLFDLRTLLAMAQQGDKRAAFLLGSRYASGREGLRDDSEAVRWFRVAAESGLAEAQYNLGVMYASGRGVKPDLAEAARWYRRAADQGLAEAQFNLGTLYGTGRGVSRDEGRAAQWLRRAAERGLARAQYNLGVLYEYGRGVRLDGYQALAWYERAAEQGFEPAKARHVALEARLTAPLDRGGADTAGAAPPAEAVASGPPPPEPSPAAEPDPVRTAAAAPPRDGPGAWPADLDPAHYTIQLASFTDRDDAERFRAGLPNGEPNGIYRSRKRGRRWYSVVRGEYSTYAAAQAAAAALPERLRRIKPWVRKVGRIQGEMD